MSNFSVFQNRQMYVVNKYNATIADDDPVGTIGGVKVITDGLKKKLFFLYKGVDGVMKSDFIQLENLDRVQPIAAAAQRVPLKSMKVVLDPAVNGGDPIPGQDYVLRIEFKQFFSDGDDSQYFKNACVHAFNGMSAADFYAALKDSLEKNFAREPGATKTSNPYLKFTFHKTGNVIDGLIISEKPQEWERGTKKQRRIQFNVVPTFVYDNFEDVIWGKATDVTPARLVDGTGNDAGKQVPNPNLSVTGDDANAMGNGKKIADLEYFCMGERGDQYHMVGWPNVINTQYVVVDTSKEYNLIEIHHAFTDDGVSSYRSEKDITIVAESASELNKLITAINNAAALNIATL